MDGVLEKLLLDTRFTTNKIPKEFLLRRVGLGYSIRSKRLDRDIIKPCLKAKKNKEKALSIQEEESEDAGRSESVKKKARSRKN
ncbi:uncharacterized protein Eint_070915 [Encephalitozoon intestinalis ATCC 50506]|uniref:Uncharacterized protein n=1 Tax=Encephalitozoon intestinalis (strain ATCC 50506) TaxID=876142 RepID=W8P9B1_ENCIT|nr:uncharacterized protein Eint_070915 [Encephalitozoon intestinalis ATCC 50506]AHL30127.1 hypothetical protein Eint_070915 [Encephalitozoon intestinalis ATCC 50506]UTX45607.1 hypothetical protein GPK93_07g11720 [Encephalitozoon intestinalis]